MLVNERAEHQTYRTEMRGRVTSMFPGLIVYRIYVVFNEDIKTCPMCTRYFVPLFYLCALTGSHVVRVLGSLALGSWLFDPNTIGLLICVY